MDWPQGRGEMAACIRDFDWASTPLGALAQWSPTLRVAVDLALDHAEPAQLCIGDSRTQLYNDGYAALIADRHPGALGQDARDTCDGADLAVPLARAFAGETVTQTGRPEPARFDFSAVPVRGEDGAVFATLVLYRERAGAEAAPSESDLADRRLLHAIDDGFCTLEVLFTDAGHPYDYRFLQVNPAFEHQTGLADAAGRTARELVANHPQSWFDRFGRIVRSRHPERFEDELAVLGRWYEVHAVPVGRPEQHRLAVLFRDILPHLEAEAALRESEGRFRAFVTASSDIVYRMSADWSQMRRLEGRAFLTNTDAPSATWLERYIHPDDRPAVHAAIARSIETRSTFELEHRVIRADGSLGWILSRAVPIVTDGGTITEWLGTARDVTPRKDVEAALRASEERQTFLLKLSDVLRPLADPSAIQAAAMNALGPYLAVGRAHYVEVLEDGDTLRPGPAYLDGMVAIPNVLRLSAFGDQAERYRDGQVVVEHDALRNAAPDSAIHEAFVGIQVRASLGVPLVKSGHLVAIMGVNQATPRAWTQADATLLKDVAERTWAAVERARVESALRDSEERFRQFAASSSDALWIRDAATLTMEFVSPAIETIYGVAPDAILGAPQRWTDLIVAEDRAVAFAQLAAACRGEAVLHEFRIRRPADGEIRWIRNTDFPLRDARGDVQRIGGLAEDVTEIRHAQERLSASETRQRVLIEGIPQLVWRALDGGRWTWASPQWGAYTGQSQEDSRGFGWLQPIHPDDRDLAIAAWHDAEVRGVLDVEYRLCHIGQKRYRWFQSRAQPVRDARGHILEWLGTSTDIDDLRRLQEQQGIMVTELQHRTRNLITVVRSIAHQTMAHTGPSEDFRRHFNDRLAALSRVQGLLSRSDQEPITLRTLIESELDALGAAALNRHIAVEGPPVRLRKAHVQTLALALHELATNARKYGALTAADGRLAVTWRIRAEAGEDRRLLVHWVEEGIERPPEVPGAVRTSGYGRELIERALPYVLNARTRYDLGETTLRCSIEIPLTGQAGTEI